MKERNLAEARAREEKEALAREASMLKTMTPAERMKYKKKKEADKRAQELARVTQQYEHLLFWNVFPFFYFTLGTFFFTARFDQVMST